MSRRSPSAKKTLPPPQNGPEPRKRFRRIAILAASCAAATTIAACASDNWQKPGTSTQATAAAKRACTVVTRDFYYGPESKRYYVNVEKVDPECMRKRGFTKTN